AQHICHGSSFGVESAQTPDPCHMMPVRGESPIQYGPKQKRGISMLRDRLNAALKDAMRAKDTRRLTTLRLILAAIKDRDIAARSDGREGLDDQAISELLAKMIKQRQDSIKAYEEGGRLDLVEQEREEIAIIEEYLPPQMSEEDVQQVVTDAIAEVGAQGIKDIGRVMAVLKERYAGQMDFAKASAAVRARLS